MATSGLGTDGSVFSVCLLKENTVPGIKIKASSAGCALCTLSALICLPKQPSPLITDDDH